MIGTALAAALLLVAQAPIERAENGRAENERVRYVISQLVQRGFSEPEAEALFRDRRLEILPPQKVAPREIDWDQVIAALLKPESIQRGMDFLSHYQESLEQAETKFGVEPALLTALLRLESNLGQNTGNYVAFNVFYTLLSGQEEEKRWRWAGDNLAALASYCKTMARDCFQIRGSYSGALGAAQFLPFSVLEFGQDGNGDGVVDPFSMEDAIVSAANFLAQHGWQDDQSVALAKYYGSSEGYPRAVFAYAKALRAARAAAPAALNSDRPAR